MNFLQELLSFSQDIGQETFPDSQIFIDKAQDTTTLDELFNAFIETPYE